MVKRMVVFCGGTGHQIADYHFNGLKLARVLRKSALQVIYYDPSLATLGAHNEWARIKQNIEKMSGLIFGYGLSRGAYSVLGLARHIIAIGLPVCIRI